MRLVGTLVLFLASVALGCGSGDNEDPIVPLPTAPRSATVAATVAQPADPSKVVHAFADAVNAGRAAEAKALLAPDATWERGGQCPPGLCVGIARLGQEIDRDIAASHRLDIVKVETTGDTVTAKVELKTQGTRAAGIERVVQTFTVRVVSGRIVALRAENDLSDPVTAAFVGQRGR